jgi:hypothetical protein
MRRVVRAGTDRYRQAIARKLTGVIALANAVPSELISVSTSEYADFVLAISTIEFHLAVWTSRGNVGSMPPVRGTDAITVLRRVLVKCLDEYPLPARTSFFLSLMANYVRVFVAT